MRDGLKNIASFFGIGSGSAQGQVSLQSNDVASPARSARPTRSPTQCHHPSDTNIDLTPSTQSSTRTVSLHHTTYTKAPRSGPASDVRRLIQGRYDAPTDAVVVPNPGDFFRGSQGETRAMGKPGAEHSRRPVNSIDRSSNRPATYGKSYTTASVYNFLDEDPASLAPMGSRSSAIGQEPPAKRRRLDDLDMSTASKNRDRNSGSGDASTNPARSTWSPNHGDNGARKKRGAGGPSGPLSQNEYNSTETLANPRHRTRNSFASRKSSNAYENGAQVTDPIVLDEDSFPKPSPFRQGSSPGSGRNRRDPTPETTSRHFPNRKAKISHSTGASRAVPMNGNVPDSGRLRDIFKRTEQAEEISEDELAPVPLPKHTSHPKTVAARAGRIPGSGYELKWARTPDFEGYEADLSLRAGKENSYRIAARVGQNISTLADIPLAKINMAETDRESRLRLKGPLNADKTRLVVDLEFKSSKDLLMFQAEVARSITEKSLRVREESHMVQIFRKPLASASMPSTASFSELDPKPKAGPSTQRQRGGLLAIQQRSGTTGRHQMGSDSDDFSALKRPPSTNLIDRPTRVTRAKQPAYLEVEEETATELPRYSEVYGLGAPWQHQLTYGSGRHRATVDFADLVRLDEGEFLNDQLIDFYLLWLLNQRQGLSEKVYIFNTHFFSTLTRKVPGQKGSINYAAVERWTAKEDLFGYDYIVVPINQDIHWYVAIICNVSSIARKPAIDDARSPSPPTSEAPKNAPEIEEQGTSIVADTESLSAIASPANGPGLDERDDIVFEDEPEDCSLDVVDADAVKPQPRPEKGTEAVVLDSDASETTGMRQLTLTEATPDKGLAFLDPRSSSKKSRRKSAPPVRRWNPDEPTIIILDSLAGGARSQAVRALKDYLRAEGVAKRGMEAEIPQNAFYAKDTHIPVQENFYDCGVYLLGYMQKFFENPDEFKKQLLLGEMQAKSSWSQGTMPQIRDQMRDILKNLYQHQEEERSRVKAEKKAKRAGATSQVATPAKQGAASEKQLDSSKSATPKELDDLPPKALPESSANTETLKRLGSPFEPVPKRSERLPNSPARVVKVDDSPLRAPVIKVDDSPVPPTQDAGCQAEDKDQPNSDGPPHPDCKTEPDCKPSIEGQPEADNVPEIEGKPESNRQLDGDDMPNTAERSNHSYQTNSPNVQAPGKTGTPRIRRPSPAVVIRSPKRSRGPNTVVTNAIAEANETTEARHSSPKRQKTQSHDAHKTNFGGPEMAPTEKKPPLRIPFPQVAPSKTSRGGGEESDHNASTPRSRGSSQTPTPLSESQEEITVHSPSFRATDGDGATTPMNQRRHTSPGQESDARQASIIELEEQSRIGGRGALDGVEGDAPFGYELDAHLLLAHQSLVRKAKPQEEDESQTTIEDEVRVGGSTPGAQRRTSPDGSLKGRSSTVAETPPNVRSSPGATWDYPLCL